MNARPVKQEKENQWDYTRPNLEQLGVEANTTRQAGFL
jgi:hypothetical protein